MKKYNGRMFVCSVETSSEPRMAKNGTSDCVVKIDEQGGAIEVGYEQDGEKIVYAGEKDGSGVFNLTGHGEGKACLCKIHESGGHMVFVGDWHRPNIDEGIWRIIVPRADD